MKKIVTPLLVLLAYASAWGQSLNETFEGGTIPETWTVINTSSNYLWQVASYTSNSTLSGTITGFNDGGEYAAYSATGYTRSADGLSPDQWLISPAVTVESGDVLNFMMSHNSSYNGNANVADENKVQFDVVVSTTGTATEDFVYTLFSIVPEGKKDWSNYSLSLDEFAGQQIYIAFHDHGTTNSTPLITNSLFLDNIKVDKNKVADLMVTNILSPVSGCNTVQPVTAEITCNGFGADSYNVSYQVDGGEMVTETVTAPIAGGETATYTFAGSVVLACGSDHEIKVWAEAVTDTNHDNDSTAVTVSIDDEIAFPFTMTDDNAQSSFSATATRNYRYVPYGWYWYNDDMYHGWLYRCYSSTWKSYLLSNCIALPAGAVNISFDYVSYVEQTLQVYLVTESGVYDTLVGTYELSASGATESGNVVIAVPEDGSYKIAFNTTAATRGNELLLNNINIRESAGDAATVSVDSPAYNATVLKQGVPVTASFRSSGGTLLENLPVYYQFDGGEIVSEVVPSIEASATVQHTFATTIDFTEAKTYELKVWTGFVDDDVASNDTVTVSIAAYEAQNFPYTTSFEDGEGNENWIRHNVDGDAIEWDIMQVIDGNINYAKAGECAAYISSMAGVEHNDWLISPAINAPQGVARISFYYTTRMTSSSATDGCNIKLYLATTDDVEAIAATQPVAVETITNDNVLTYRQGYAYVEIPAAGTYYLAFLNDGMGHDIILDDVRFDTAEDMCIVTAANSLTSGFNLTDNEVTVEVANHGTTTRSGIQVSYTVNEGEAVTETIEQSIAPGESVNYAFAQKVDVSAAGTYSIVVSIIDAMDADTFNNSWALASFNSYANATIPYAADFDTEEARAVWTSDGNWTLASTMSTSQSAYNGQGGLYHSANAKGENGDWVYSGCIEIPAGTYDLSFFYRTFMNQSNVDYYGQSFAIYLGTEPTQEAMTQLVYSAQDVVAYSKAYEKVIQPIEVAEDGKYYIGVQCTTTSTWGTLYIDMISIKEPVTDGIVLGTYEYEFADCSEDWYQYNPASNFEQWEVSADATCLTASCTTWSWDNMGANLPGLLVAPAFKLSQGDNIKVELGYRIAVSNIDNLSADDQALVGIGVYMANEDLPHSYSTVLANGTELTDTKATVTGSIDIAADGIYYVGVRPEGPTSAISGSVTSTYEIYSIKLWKDYEAGVQLNTVQGLLSYANNVVSINGEYENLSVYSVNGMLVGQYSGEDVIDLSGYSKGFYMLLLESADKKASTYKVIVK